MYVCIFGRLIFYRSTDTDLTSAEAESKKKVGASTNTHTDADIAVGPTLLISNIPHSIAFVLFTNTTLLFLFLSHIHYLLFV